MDKQDEALKLLKDVRQISHQIETIQEQIEQIRSMLTSTTIKPKEVDVQTSRSQDPMGDRIGQILEYEEILQSYQSELCAKKTKVINILKQMSIRDQEVLTVRYIQGKTIEQTAEYFDKSYYGIWKILNKAEDNFIKFYIEVDRS